MHSHNYKLTPAAKQFPPPLTFELIQNSLADTEEKCIMDFYLDIKKLSERAYEKCEVCPMITIVYGSILPPFSLYRNII
jgi:hypothetical protein